MRRSSHDGGGFSAAASSAWWHHRERRVLNGWVENVSIQSSAKETIAKGIAAMRHIIEAFVG